MFVTDKQPTLRELFIRNYIPQKLVPRYFSNSIIQVMDEIQRAQLNTLNQKVVDGVELTVNQEQLRSELTAIQQGQQLQLQLQVQG